MTDAEILNQFKDRYSDLEAGGRFTEQEVFRALYQVYTIRNLELMSSISRLEHFADALQLLSDNVFNNNHNHNMALI